MASRFKDEIIQCAELFNTDDFYAVIGLKGKDSTKFTDREIQKGYKSAAMEVHPDRVHYRKQYEGATDEEVRLATKKFQLLSVIIKVLSDPTLKKIYDEMRAISQAKYHGEASAKVGTNFDKFFDIPVRVWSKSAFDQDLKKTYFEDMNLPKTLLENVLDIYEIPTPIQQRAIPYALQFRDVLGWSPTGSGKTAAYAIPLLALAFNSDNYGRRLPVDPALPSAVVLLPTRELALQVASDFKKLTEGMRIQLTTVFGGRNRREQKYNLRDGCDILIGTPGRVTDFIKEKVVSLREARYLVLDEADLMLDMGFEKQVREIVELGAMPVKEHRINWLFSATFPRAVQLLAKDLLIDSYVHIKVDSARTDERRENADRPFVINKDISQTIHQYFAHEKYDKLVEVLKNELKDAFIDEKWTKKVLIFHERKTDADNLAAKLVESGILARTINARRYQEEREGALNSFSNGNCPVLVATSVAARGLDIKGIDLVINYRLPSGYDDKGEPRMTVAQRIAFYIQRIGRTGRVGNLGRAITFYDPESVDVDLRGDLIKVLAAAEQRVPEWLYKVSSSACLLACARTRSFSTYSTCSSTVTERRGINFTAEE